MRRLLLTLMLVPVSAFAQRAPPTTGSVVVETPLRVGDTIRPRRGNHNAAFLLNRQEIFTPENYPELARQRRIEGTVRVRVQVNPQGLATHCEAVGSPPAELSGPTCALFLAQARFLPARDRRGHAVKSTYTRSVHWKLEDLEPLPFVDRDDTVIFTFNDDGSISSCRRIKPVTRADLVEPDETICANLEMMARLVTVNSGLTQLSQWELRAESLVRVGPYELWRSIGAGEDNLLVSRLSFRLDIGPDGTVRGCVPTEPGHEKAAEDLAICEQMKYDRFAASPEPRRTAHAVQIIYFRRKTSSSKTS